jgi:anti-anti-sigma regulatory factor
VTLRVRFHVPPEGQDASTDRLADTAETLLITHSSVVLDLAGVSYLNADGLRALLLAHKHR